MKKTTLILSACACLLGFAVTALAGGPVKLTYSNFFPPTHIQSQLAEQWCREVEKRTNGKVRIDYFPGSTLSKAHQNYDGVVEGISDIGMSCLAYSRGRFPVMAAIDLPLGYRTGAQATRVANAVYEHFKPEELSDVQPMYFHAHGPGLLFTTEKPVAAMADLKGLKIRSTGNSALLVEALGGTPVAKPMSETYQSLQRGIVDGSIHPVESNKGWKLAEVVKFGTESFSVAYTTTFFVVMNKDKWNALDPDVQAAIMQINKEWADRHGAAWDDADALGRQYLLDQGGKFIALSDAESAAWAKAAQPVMDQYVKTVAEKKIDGAAVVDFIKAEMTKAQ
ncbi:TRAP transporter substrate-binding protein [Pseudodesulfovibrio sp.]|uniref:TRAP transporter substrate-binding protein n=1 Tax=Pseudodesulfovibrio sp. TaxID=2035812 RepID=UPI002610681F|nr:TRAP transporter substrate-binding protein [Pseudodesulfovibrio sp.]MDD3311537.1 TRAP transporter substrate-binding protein [Pseudodesulfovibrio sp.]